MYLGLWKECGKTGIALQRLGLNPRAVHVGFVVDGVVLVLLRVVLPQFSFASYH
jgi:hypothetical protein